MAGLFSKTRVHAEKMNKTMGNQFPCDPVWSWITSSKGNKSINKPFNSCPFIHKTPNFIPVFVKGIIYKTEK